MYNYNDFIRDYRQNNINPSMFDYNQYIMNTPNNINNNMNLFTPKEGYEKGNLFKNLYSQYKNYVPKKITPTNERERLWLELAEACFAKHELNLYLDLNPNDESMITLFNDYRKKIESLEKQYESSFGPLNNMSDSLNTSPFLWETKNFPWEGGND